MATPAQQPVRRRPFRQYAGHQPDITPIPISSRYSTALQSTELIELAHVFSRLEDLILSTAIDVMQNDTRDLDSRSPDEQQRIIQLDTAREDLRQVYAGTYQFSAGYLKSREFLREWTYVAVVIRELFRLGTNSSDDSNAKIAASIAKDIARLAGSIPDALKLTARTGVFDVLTKNTIGDKYTLLDVIIDLLCENTNHVRTIDTW